MNLLSSPKTIINGALFQAVWWSCVVLQGYWALAITGVFVVIHCRFFIKPKELYLIAIVTVVGIAVDHLLQFIGVFQTGGLLLPLWLWCLWLGFACTLSHALQWFHGKPLMSVLMGCIGGGSSYFGAIRLGAAQTDFSLLHVGLIFGLVWAVLFPLFIALAMRMTASPLQPTD